MGREVDLQAHLARMRATAVAALVLAVAAIPAVFLMSHRQSSVASPTTVTVVAAIACLWIGFSANRDATGRLEKIRRAFAVHGDEDRLLRDHWLVYCVVVIRLEVMVVGGLIVGLYGLGPGIGVWLLILGILMIVLTWPTIRKSQLLLGRARALRDDVQP